MKCAIFFESRHLLFAATLGKKKIVQAVVDQYRLQLAVAQVLDEEARQSRL